MHFASGSVVGRANKSTTGKDMEMEALIVYDSKFGNTEQIAQAIATTLAEQCTVLVLTADDALLQHNTADLVIVGGPTQGHGASNAMKAFLHEVERQAIAGRPAAAFDTRFKMARWLSGSAAGVIARRLEKAGATLVVPPESFFVARAAEGPLLEGELERASAWARTILAAVPAPTHEAAVR
jgi:flavodoxin